MYKVLFICHGNICRSPMAEYIMKDLVKKSGESIYVESCATSSEEIGNTIYYEAKNILKKHNIWFEDRKARKIKNSDYEVFDLLIAMDEENMWHLKKDEKVHKLRDFSDGGGDVEDPWYTRNFEKVFEQISEGCKGLLEYIKENA